MKKKKLILIGAADSIGVPYSRDNRNHIGFFEMMEEYLSKNYDVKTINCFHMSTNNDNNYIDKIISNPISLLDIKKSQNEMLKKCKYSGIYPYLEMPKRFLNHYRIDKQDKNLVICKTIQSNSNIIFIYSAFVNDLLKSRKLSLFKLLKPGKIKKELRKINTKNILNKLEANIEKLITMNPNMKIYIIGLFTPTKIKYIRENTAEFIFNTNNSLNEISKKYNNVVFINNDNLSTKDFNNIDFHPNKSGHTKIYHNFIEVFEKD